MAFNKKLWSLGNRFVELERKIHTAFPHSVTNSIASENVFQTAFMDILDLMNEMRRILNEPEDSPKHYDIRVICTEKQLFHLEEKLEEMQIKFDMMRLDDGQFITRT